ncbi:MAG: VWA domain-containing protein [Treponema sp.]|nr:VWA domain-containing protein [Treponema sp.]MCL2237419.1 VWA domain-containing protein [Treponema sp.]
MMMDNLLKRKLFLSRIFFILFLALAIVALIGPKWGMGYAPSEYRRGLDIVFAMDVSRSMDIRDLQSGTESRLERGVKIAINTIASVPGARYAAAIGRGRGYLAVPLTYDNESALGFLSTIGASSMTGRSTNLEALIEAAASAFIGTSPARKIIVLISDGESHSGNIRNAINLCAREGIYIFAVAVGSDEGARIFEQDDVPDSQVVISRREAAVMRTTAERTGGMYIDGNRDDAAISISSGLLSAAQDLENNSLPGEKAKTEPVSRRPLFAVLALIAYCASKFVTRKTGKLPLSATASLLAILFVFTSCSQGKLLLIEANYLNSRGRFDEALVPYLKALEHEDAAPYAEYGIGLAFYLMDQEKAALSRYNDSQKKLENFPDSEHRELRFRNHYNTGIILFEDGKYESAADSFRDALRTDPRRLDAKRNLELALVSISMEAKQENRTETQQEQRSILFEYLKDEEQRLWRSREWTAEEEYTGPDY